MADWSPERLKEFAASFDRSLEAYLASCGDVPPRLGEAVRYSVLAPGKRMRPYLATRCCELVGGSVDDAWPAAAAVECVHAFSLVHDDLPAMDNDDLRRGRPTTHKKFDEATAILAGDALVALAFEILATKVPDAARSVAMVSELAGATGWSGMIGGQSADLFGEREPASLERTRYIHERKTGKLFTAACRLGALAGGGDGDDVERLGAFGRHFGHAFQIADDLLDVTADAGSVGKAVGKDAIAGKQTYPRSVGIDVSREAADQAVASAIDALDSLGPAADELRSLAKYAVFRNY